MSESATSNVYDLFVIGGGVNGCGIARDASGRGLRVALAEMNDLASATSSASTKLFHGGLRYLEYFEFRLVREALMERETLLKAMPHISWPMRFVLPYHRDMRFESETPTSKLLKAVMPWMKGRRPAWLIRLGLFIYDTIGGRHILPATTTLDLTRGPEGAPLKKHFIKAYEYSDCWVEDSRLVILNARDAAARGAKIMVRSKVVLADRDGDLWRIETEDQDTGQRRFHHARILVNAAGPWVGDILRSTIRSNTQGDVRLVRGSHIVTRRLYDHDKCYFLQGRDGRIIFVIPYEQDFSLIGTTDQDHDAPSTAPVCSAAEQNYLIDFVNQYFQRQLSRDDVVWSYSGVRPLFDDGASSATAATRDYTLVADANGGAPVLNVFGGKITTYRKLAESALDKVAEYLPDLSGPWTAGIALPGGDFAVAERPDLLARLRHDYPFLTGFWAERLIRAYGTEAWQVLGKANSFTDLGQDFGATLTEAEVRWQISREFARGVNDVIWRRSKLGLRMSAEQIEELKKWMAKGNGNGTTMAAE
ncbi:glycerol-3-phosphate dehydrogenase [Pseudooceanicola sp.]|uniref:glycerol-3-phosphate dehydrogenase n=1 Tax=Pseudooceanicola sp. TaxID=1914328 RepID=UPI002626E03D|nr:glycerol-3-phosphate dehydrogenase [Pseudooceanicola sp.]MDF1854399.1 glycerol-3-phosphate dehydrogenase [Pseudooceanicola sp.]